MSSPNVNALQFRRALGCFATGVAIATTLDSRHKPVGMTISSFNSVSLDPPLVLWSIAVAADGYDAFMQSDYFAVNVLAKDQASMSDRFAISGSDKFADIATVRGIENIPILEHAAACFECKTEHVYAGGDHKIIVGRVLRCSDTDADPLVFFRGEFLK